MYDELGYAGTAGYCRGPCHGRVWPALNTGARSLGGAPGVVESADDTNAANLSFDVTDAIRADDVGNKHSSAVYYEAVEFLEWARLWAAGCCCGQIQPQMPRVPGVSRSWRTRPTEDLGRSTTRVWMPAGLHPEGRVLTEGPLP